MKKLIFIAAIMMSMIITQYTYAQRYAYVDVEYILNNIPEYEEAQKKLDGISEQWQKEIEEEYKKIDQLYKSYQAEQVLLTEDMKRKKENEILAKEREVKDMQKRKFGYDGELFKKRQELIKPIQDKAYKAIEEMAKLKRYDLIFDKSSGSVILYSNPIYDKSNDILKSLGYTPSKNANESK